MTDQLILNFPIVKNYSKEDFYVSPSNEKAYDFVKCWIIKPITPNKISAALKKIFMN